MWLDRFSANNTPGGTSPLHGRSYSPVPRRTYPPPNRQGFNPRSSSLSLASPASSTTSLPAGGRTLNVSGLRNEISEKPPADVAHPLQVLQNIFGAPPRSSVQDDNDYVVAKPEVLVEDIDFGGLSLHDFANAKDNISLLSPMSPTVDIYSIQSIDEFDKESDRLEDLHKSISACDEVLKSVETYLANFQSDLGSVSAEIETLQTRSSTMDTKVKNRDIVEKKLGPSVEQITISPSAIRTISTGPVDDGFVRALAELERRSSVLATKTKDNVQIKALEDAGPLFRDLTNRAISQIRDYVVAQIKALRSPSINAQLIQQQGFLKYKELFSYLAKHHQKLADEICQAYQKALEKLKLHSLDKSDLLGQDDTAKRGPLLSNSRAPIVQHDALSIGRRLDLLKSPSSAAITAYVAEEDKNTHYLEVPFRAFNQALIDNASFEYTFLTTFFGPSQSHHSISRIFTSIFESTFSVGQTLTKQLTDASIDALGVLLCVRLNQHFAFTLQRRKVPSVEGYINGTNMLLWPRFQLVMGQHCDSVRKLTAAATGRPAGASASILATTSTSGSAAAGAQSAAPHPLAQKFASFMHGILALSSEAGDDEPVANSVGRLRGEFEACLTKLSKSIGEQRKRERFLYNNYSLVGTILEDAEGKLASDMKTHFGSLKDAYAGDTK